MTHSKKLNWFLGVMLDVELPELVVLKHNLQRMTWLEEVADTKEDEDEVTLEVLRNLLDAGVELPPHPLVEKEMADLQVRYNEILININSSTSILLKMSSHSLQNKLRNIIDKIINYRS